MTRALLGGNWPRARPDTPRSCWTMPASSLPRIPLQADVTDQRWKSSRYYGRTPYIRRHMLGNKVLAYPKLSSPSTPHFAACIFCLEAWTPSSATTAREHSSPSQYQTEDSASRIQLPSHVPPPTAHCSAVGPSTKPLALTVGKTTQAAGYPFPPVRVPRQRRKAARTLQRP